MGARKGWDHIRRPKTDKTWCGLPWMTNVNQGNAHRETCPQCGRKSKRGN